jgi:hypothetical protein
MFQFIRNDAFCYPAPGGYKYGDLVLQFEAVSDEKVIMVMGPSRL